MRDVYLILRLTSGCTTKFHVHFKTSNSLDLRKVSGWNSYDVDDPKKFRFGGSASISVLVLVSYCIK